MDGKTWSLSQQLKMVIHDKDENFLPDLPNDLSGEQIVFQHKVFRSNESFNKVHNDIILWFKSPSDKRQYPLSKQNNKNSFRKKVEMYSYESESGVLYKRVKSSDGIGKYDKAYYSEKLSACSE